MPKKVPEKSAVKVRNLTDCGLTAVGGVTGLYLKRTPTGNKSWILRAMVGAKRRDIGLGGFPSVSLAEAREKAREVRAQIQAGIDPVLQRKANRSAVIREQSKATTFEELARVYIQRKGKEYKTLQQLRKLTQQLEDYALPVIGRMFVSDIEMSHVVAMLEPIWETKTETAKRLRLHTEKIIDIAIADKKRSEINPARWVGMLEHSSLPAAGKVSKVKHHEALPVDLMPEVYRELQSVNSIGAKALLFIILTACRSGEGRGAQWDEINFEARTWTIPADRMKVKKAHVVPLSDDALTLLESLPRLTKYIFAGPRGSAITDVTVNKAHKALGHNVTTHGFRSTFKDWARLHTAYADEVSELALAHVNDDKTRAAYARDGLLDKRRLLMTDWADYCRHGKPVEAGNVVSIGGGR